MRIRLYSSFDQNCNSYVRFRFISISYQFHIEALLSKNIYDCWHPYWVRTVQCTCSFSSFFGFCQTYFVISRAVGIQFLNVLISLDLSFSISFPMPYSKLFYCQNSRSFGKKKTESRKTMSRLFFIFWIRSFKHISQFLKL